MNYLLNMCVAPIPQDKLENLNKYKYSSVNNSCTYNKILSPCLNALIKYIPMWIAPNLITFCSVICNIIALVYTYLDSGYNFGKELRADTCFIIGAFQFLYQTLDNIDGKQARRTGTATPFGMIMDHGCDVFTMVITCFNFSHLLLVDTVDFYSYSVYFGLLLGFYIMTYEDYKVGEMVFPMINGVDEGNIFIFLCGITLAFTGQGWLRTVVYKDITIAKLCGLANVVAGVLTTINTFRHIYNKKGFKQMLLIIPECAGFYNVLLLPYLYYYFHTDFYLNYYPYIFFVCCMLFIHCCLDLIVKTVTMDNLSCNIMVIFTNAMMIISLILPVDTYKLYCLGALGICQMIELVVLVVIRVNELTGFLGIRLFVIEPKVPI